MRRFSKNLTRYSAAFLMMWSLSCAEAPEAPAVLLGSSDGGSASLCQDIEVAANRLQEVSSLLYKFCVEDFKSSMDQSENIYGLSNPQAKVLSKVTQNPDAASQSNLESFYTVDVDASVEKLFAMKYLESSDPTSFVARGFTQNSSETLEVYSQSNNGDNERNQHLYTNKVIGSVEVEYEAGRRFLKIDENNYIVFNESITTKPTKGILYLKDIQIISRLSAQKSRIYSISSYVVDTAPTPTILSLLQNEISSERLRLFQNAQQAPNSL